MGRRPRAAAVSGAMRHEALTYRRAAAARPAEDGVGAAEEGTHVRTHGEAQPGPMPHGEAQSAAPTSRRMRFSVTSPPGRRGAQPPASLRGTMESGPTGQTCSSNPPPGCGGVRRARRPRPAGLASRKSAVWAEGLAEGAPRVRPGHYQAASCGLRRCRELRVRSPARVPLSRGSMDIPSSCLAARQQGIGCSEC